MRRLAQLLVVVSIPIVLTLTNVRLLMTSAFARWEYARPGFPPPAEVVAQANTATGSDTSIVPIEMRQLIVDTTLDYVKGAGDESLIAEDLTFENGRRAYNQREVGHLTDVRVLVGQTTIAHILGGLIIVLGVGFLVWTNRHRSAAAALVTGAGLTVGLIGFVGLVAGLAFRFFFVRFHRVFFTGETWLFPSTDTLIQIFPETFWFDASLLIVLLTLVEAAVMGIAALVWLRRLRYAA
ncbi:MAG: hypothetical protein MAG451_01336 [Anaerolineales bacterium]|nr:hypothetical protein [Anaerolineales bacterium]